MTHLPKNGNVHLHGLEKHIGLSVAFVLLKIDPLPDARQELCDLCETVNDVFDAVITMREASGDRMTAAIRLMRIRRATAPPGHLDRGH